MISSIVSKPECFGTLGWLCFPKFIEELLLTQHGIRNEGMENKIEEDIWPHSLPQPPSPENVCFGGLGINKATVFKDEEHLDQV